MVDPTASRGATLSEPRTRGNLLHRIMVSAVAFVVLYGAAYGLARWRKLIVMAEHWRKEEGQIVRETQPGRDVRSDWRGRAKNHTNSVAFFLFRPLCALEDVVRGGSRPIR